MFLCFKIPFRVGGTSHSKEVPPISLTPFFQAKLTGAASGLCAVTWWSESRAHNLGGLRSRWGRAPGGRDAVSRREGERLGAGPSQARGTLLPGYLTHTLIQ